MDESGLQGSVSELEPFTAIGAAAPECAVRVGDISDPSSVARKVDIAGGDAAQKRHNLICLGIKFHQFAFELGTYGEKMIAVLGRKKAINLEWARGELNGQVRSGASEGDFFRKSPNIANTVMDAEEDVVFSVGSPSTAAFGSRIIPPGQEFAQVGAIEACFPNRGQRARRAKGGKAEVGAIGRKLEP